MTRLFFRLIGALELVTDKRGKLSNTRLASATTYLVFTLAFLSYSAVGLWQWIKTGQYPENIEGIWTVYAGVAAVAAGHQYFNGRNQNRIDANANRPDN